MIITENGEFYKNGKKLNIVKNRGYGIVTYYENGEQVSHYAHRLFAEKFVDNPENKDLVYALDGNYLNLSVDNLIFITQSELSKMGWENRDGYEKCDCGMRFYTGRGAEKCPKCIQREIQEENEIVKRHKRSKRTAEQIKDAHIDGLASQVARMRLEGMTYQEIGDKLGYSKQHVNKVYLDSINE